MKTIIQLVIAAFIAATFTSCVVPTQRSYSRQGYGPQQSYGQQQGYGQKRITGYKKVAHTTTLRAYVQLGADAPQEVVQRAEQATANQVGFEYAQSFEAGGKPVWPSTARVTQIAQQKLSANGCKLTPGQPGQPGCFKVMKYTPGVK